MYFLPLLLAATGDPSGLPTQSAYLHPIVVVWEATGGTISQSGLYTAGATAGTYKVVARILGTNLLDEATVTLTGQGPSSPQFPYQFAPYACLPIDCPQLTKDLYYAVFQRSSRPIGFHARHTRLVDSSELLAMAGFALVLTAALAWHQRRPVMPRLMSTRAHCPLAFGGCPA